MKHKISLILCLSGLIALVGCDWRESIFDFASDPLLPPVSQIESGTYETTFWTKLDMADDTDDTRILYTFDPRLPFTEMDSWIDYQAAETPGFEINQTTSLRTFAYASETRYSEVKTLTWTLKCPAPKFNYKSGPIASYNAEIRLETNWDPAFTTIFTLDGPDPRTSPTVTIVNGGSGSVYCASLSPTNLSVRVAALTSRPGWNDSDLIDALFTVDLQSVGLIFILDLPDSTNVTFTGQNPILEYGVESMTVSAQPEGLDRYEWSLNGEPVMNGATAYSGSSISLGHLAASALSTADVADLGDLPGNTSYTLSCIATDGNGNAYSNSIDFSVVIP